MLGGLSPAGQRVAGAMFLGLSLAQRRFGRVAAPLARGLVDVLKRRGRRRARHRGAMAPLRGLRTQGLPFQPVVDGEVIPATRSRPSSAGQGASRSPLIGTNLDESKLFAPLDPEAATLDEAGLVARCEEAIGAGRAGAAGLGRRAVEVYRAARAARGERVEPGELWFAIETDRTMRHPAMSLAARQAAHQPQTYAYLFTWPSPVLGGMLGSVSTRSPCPSSSARSSIDCSAHRRPRPGGAGSRRADRRRLDRLRAPAGPRTGPFPDWPAYDAAHRRTMILDWQRRVDKCPARGGAGVLGVGGSDGGASSGLAPGSPSHAALWPPSRNTVWPVM